MQDMQTHLEKLRVQMAECEMIRDLATEPAKRELFGRLAEHFGVLVREIENTMTMAERASGHVAPPESR